MKLFWKQIVVYLLYPTCSAPTVTKGKWNKVDEQKLCSSEAALVCDPDRILAEKERKQLEYKLDEIAKNTKCSCYSENECTNSTHGYTVSMVFLQSQQTIGSHPKNKSNVLDHFAHSFRRKRPIGHCDDDALVVICLKCKQAAISQGDLLTRKRIPSKVIEAMETQTNQLLAFTNRSLAVKYLLINYEQFLQMNQTLHPATVAMLRLPYVDLSTGVITVMLLTCALAVGWALCITHLAVQLLHTRRANSSSILQPADNRKRRTREKPILLSESPTTSESARCASVDSSDSVSADDCQLVTSRKQTRKTGVAPSENDAARVPLLARPTLDTRGRATAVTLVCQPDDDEPMFAAAQVLPQPMEAPVLSISVMHELHVATPIIDDDRFNHGGSCDGVREDETLNPAEAKTSTNPQLMCVAVVKAETVYRR